MRKGGSNQKGGEFERFICRVLSFWITGSERPEIFWRSAASGAKATLESKAGRESYMGGDIVAVRPEGHWFTSIFSVELKDRRSFGTLPFLLQGRAPLIDWWIQCCGDANRTKRTPLMVFKQRGSPVYAAVRENESTFALRKEWMAITSVDFTPFRVCLLEDLLLENDQLPGLFLRKDGLSTPKFPLSRKPQAIKAI